MKKKNIHSEPISEEDRAKLIAQYKYHYSSSGRNTKEKEDKKGLFSRKKKKEGPNFEQYKQFVLEGIDVLPDAQKRMIRGVFALAHTCVREMMIPLSEIMAVHIATSTEQLKAMVRDTGYSFIPVYEDRIDRLTGIVSVIDVLYAPDGDGDLSSFIRPAYYVPETKIAVALLEELRTAEEPIALVIDEHESCVGLVTLEDILEQIVGEIGYAPASSMKIEKKGEMSWVIDARANINRVNEHLGTDIPKDQYDTIGGFLLKMIGHLPEVGEKVKYKNREFAVAEISDYGISMVSVNPVQPMLPDSKKDKKRKKQKKIKHIPSNLESNR